PTQELACSQKRENKCVDGQQNQARHVHQRKQPVILANEIAPFREGQDEVQKQGWLQQPRNHIAPIHDPVKLVEFAGVVERVKDERCQAKNIETLRTVTSRAPKKKGT